MITAVLVAIPLLVPLASAGGSLVAGWRPLTAWANVAAALSILAAGIILGVRVTARTEFTAGHLLRADPLSATMLIVIGAVATLATWAGVDYLGAELAEGKTTSEGARQYVILVPLFLSAMVLAVEANNLGLVWTAVEATTIATAFLVGHRRTRQSLEATWKYVVVCSFGITIAFLGTVVLYFASIHAGASASVALNLDTLSAVAAHLNPAVTRLAVGLLLIGFGAKAGLVPFHTWLADAHSQAPAPVSALMSGVLLSVAFSILLRIKVISDVALGLTYMRVGLLVSGLATLVVAVSLLVGQSDFKRMFAYSSLEQMGLLAVAAAADTRLAVAGTLLVVAAHGIAKAILFISAGQLQHAHGSTLIADVTAVGARSPLLGATLAVGVAGLLGFPPFAVFAGELAMARGLARAGLSLPLLGASALLLVGFVAISRHTAAMLLGAEAPGSPSLRVAGPVAAPLVIGLAASVILGTVGGPFAHLLTAAATSLGANP
ncbi:MAG: hydrogenase [Acidobacteriota bacterium]|nr:hydrogenase [Acidobacteriota bacterium]